MKDVIHFNRETSIYFESKEDENRMFLRYTELCMNDYLVNRGYVYLNQIYDNLGVRWDPQRDNPCCIYSGTPIKFVIQGLGDNFKIGISW